MFFYVQAAFLQSVVIAGGFESALGKQGRLLGHKNVMIADQFADQQIRWKESSKISEILKLQIGAMFHAYERAANQGGGREQRLDLRRQLRKKFESVKNYTQNRLQEEHTQKSSKHQVKTTGKNPNFRLNLYTRRFRKS